MLCLQWGEAVYKTMDTVHYKTPEKSNSQSAFSRVTPSEGKTLFKGQQPDPTGVYGTGFTSSHLRDGLSTSLCKRWQSP